MADNSVLRSVAIVLCDNDFGKTFTALLKSIYESFRWNDQALTGDDIAFLIQKGIEFHYAAFQHRFEFAREFNQKFDDKVQPYCLNKVRILFDEEAEKDYETRDRDMGAWFLCLRTGNVSPY